MLNRLIASLLPYLPKKLIWVFSKRYIAGETINDGLKVSSQLNSQGMEITIDLLGENISNLQQARSYKEEYIEIIKRFTAERIKGNFSLKPTMFGLLIDEETCYNHLKEIVNFAAMKNNFIRIDMENSECVDAEFALYQKLKNEFPNHVGIVLQAYLRRTQKDLANLIKSHTNRLPINIRLCKGIYIEPPDIAFVSYQEVRDHFLENLRFCFENNIYVGIATHDKFLIDGALSLIKESQVSIHKYEFQMLYGVTPSLRNSIVNQGHKMRIYVPFGKEWLNYSTRRLKENHRMATHIIKAIFFRG